MANKDGSIGKDGISLDEWSQKAFRTGEGEVNGQGGERKDEIFTKYICSAKDEKLRDERILAVGLMYGLISAEKASKIERER